MPYMKVTEGSKTKVYKKGPDGEPTGKALGSHDSEAEAQAQIAALNASEDEDKDATASPTAGTQAKEANHTKCGYYDDYIFVPWGVTSFADLEAARQMEEAGKEARKLTSAFSQLASNILGSMDISNKAQALSKLASEFTSKIGSTIRGKEAQPSEALEQDTKALSTSLLSLSQPENEQPAAPPAGEGEVSKESGSSLLIWKEGGVYKWVAAYSNNFRDDDNPPEIISTQSHKEFDEALEKGEWPLPELWLWHIPYRVGETHYHAFDEETGFVLAAGTFDEGKEWAAEGVIAAGWDEVSHGMVKSEIERDEKDKTIITRHRTREISFLPKGRAANKLAFNVISKEIDMAIPEHKREGFIKAVGAERVEEIDQALDNRAKTAKEAGTEQKEQAETPEAAPVTESQPAVAAQSTFTLQDLATAIGNALKPVVEEVKALNDRVKELEKTDAQKIAEKAATTPAASLEAMILEQVGGGLFSKATQVDGRTSLAQSKPKEAAAQTGNKLFFENWLQPGS